MDITDKMADKKSVFEFLVPEKYRSGEVNSIPPNAVWQGFMDHTTAHGISHWNNARGNHSKGLFKLAVHK